MAWKDLTNCKFGRWIVLNRAENKGANRAWNCICECGTKRIVRGVLLLNGTSKSCGCFEREYKRDLYKTHEFARSKNKNKLNFYRVWQSIKTRCYNSKCWQYKDYGAREIVMCEKWKNSFEEFKNDMWATYKPGLTIERIDVNGNYEPSNCRWATRSEQARNRRCSIRIDTLQGNMTINEAAKIVGISWLGMYQRVRNNWPKDKLLTPSNFKLKVDKR